MNAEQATAGYTGKTAWARNLATPVRDFLSAETGGAVVLIAAVVAALIWANSPWSDSYESFWTTKLAITIGSGGISMDIRHWVNEGLMTFFFLVVGLEAKRELDTGELRERQRRIRRHRGAPGVRAVPPGVHSGEDQNRHQHSAESGEHRDGEALALAQLPGIELPLRLEADDEEEEGHQALVHPMADVH